MWFTSVRLTFVAIRGRRVHMFVPRDKKVHGRGRSQRTPNGL